MANNKGSPQPQFGDIFSPEKADPPPKPLALLAAQMTHERCQTNPVSPSVQRMLDDLPPKIKTQKLQAEYMRILDRLAANWAHPGVLKDYFDDLLFESRSERSGLSFEAVVELTELKEYVMRVKVRRPTTVWDQAFGLV